MRICTCLCMLLLALSAPLQGSPAVIGTSPLHNATSVLSGSDVSVTFDADMNAATINDLTLLVHSDLAGRRQGTISYNPGTRTAIFDPLVDFLPGERVSVSITTGIESVTAVPLERSYVLFFVTASGEGTAAYDSSSGFWGSVSTNYADQIAGADLDEDMNVDLVTRSNLWNTITVWDNDGSGQFFSYTDHSDTDYDQPVTLNASDMDNDLATDLLVGFLQTVQTSNGPATMIMKNYTGVFGYDEVINGGYPVGVAASDFDGDGFQDVVTLYQQGNPLYRIAVSINDGTGGFGLAGWQTAGSKPYKAVFCSDLNNDYYPDFITIYADDDSVAVWLNDGAGVFGTAADYAIGYDLEAVTAADLNGDRMPDIITANRGTDNVSVLINNGDGTFGSPVSYATGDGPVSVVALDLDGDGDTDIATANSGSWDVSVIVNSGTGTFPDPQEDYSTGSDAGPNSIHAADYDGDGDIDLAVSKNTSIRVMYNDNMPECYVFPTAIDYDTIYVDEYRDSSFTITNIGGGLLTGEIYGCSSRFIVISGDGPYSLAAEEEHIVTVRFVPLISGGDHMCTVTTGNEECGNVVCTGYGQRICELEPFHLDFGIVPPGNTKDTTFVLVNSGTSELTGFISGACDYYSILSGEGAFTLQPGENHIVDIRFGPAPLGSHTCVIETGDEFCFDQYCTAASCVSSDHLYVDTDATGSNDGSSWENAFTELTDAMDASVYCTGVSEIWVAEGTYRPTLGTDRYATFQLRNGLALYGGFNGTEAEREMRDFEINVTILSGEIGDTLSIDDNSLHVVTAWNADATAILDGFTVTRGNADEEYGVPEGQKGGGMLYFSGSPLLSNIIFSENHAVNGGGIALIMLPTPYTELTNIEFVDNSAYFGGGMYISDSGAILRNLTFEENNAGVSGGGIYNLRTYDNDTIRVENALFIDNSCSGSGGGICNKDCMEFALTNAVFEGNTATYGGGIMNNESAMILTNASFYGNTVSSNGSGMLNYYETSHNASSSGTVTNSIFWGDAGSEIVNSPIDARPTISHSCVSGSGGSSSWNYYVGIDGGNNIDEDPLYAGPATGDLTLSEGSPAIDSGDETATYIAETDIEGRDRTIGWTVDMGAYEYPTITGIEDGEQSTLPSAFALYQNVPNPFNPVTTIRFDMPRAGHVRLSVYNVKGEYVTDILNKRMSEGIKEISWSARDSRHRQLSSGIYFYRLETGDFVQTRKMVLLR